MTRSRIDYWSGGGGGGGGATNGIPSGGTTGQVLAKNSNTDFDATWQDVTGAGGITKYLFSFNYNVGNTYTVTHNLNTIAVVVDVYNTATGATIYADIVRTTLNAVTVTVGNAAPPTGNLSVVVIG